MLNHAFSQKDFFIHPTALSWVYIFVVPKSEELSIGLTFNLFKRFNKLAATEKLVYYRSFSDPFDALAHKHLLDSLSSASVLCKIKKMNPSLKDLIPEIIEKENSL